MTLLDIALFGQTAVLMGTPLLLAALGEILTEKAGHMNLGVEGMMLAGAAAGFIAGFYTNSPALAFAAAGAAGAAGALIYAVLTVSLRANQIVTGFVLTIFLSGVANFVGSDLGNSTLGDGFTSVGDGGSFFSSIPFFGPVLFEQSRYVHFSLIMAAAVWIYLNKTSPGLSLRMVGENPSSADAAGIPVTFYKYSHILAGGFLCGAGGACLTLVIVKRWQESATAGMGWIAIALVIFAAWGPLKAVFGAYLFGALRGLSFKIQNAPISIGGRSLSVPAQILDLLPYIMTVVALILITLGKKRENQPPRSLGKPYFREER
ncbi:MAG: ABC transporter permease [Synergistaceae bacterium]|jgi:simple sugar transport system permease protein|nr:ABC transporter permease [Synergistaceae bacterium]